MAAVVAALALSVSTFIVAAEGQTTTKARATKPATEVCTLKVTGMTCAGCAVAVNTAARSIDGVTDVKASYANKNAEVTYDPSKTNPAAIAKVITEKSGFKAERVEPQHQKK